MGIGPGAEALAVWFFWTILFWVGLPVRSFLAGRAVLRAFANDARHDARSAELAERLHQLEERVTMLDHESGNVAG